VTFASGALSSSFPSFACSLQAAGVDEEFEVADVPVAADFSVAEAVAVSAEFTRAFRSKRRA
jgi:hypothetical protein